MTMLDTTSTAPDGAGDLTAGLAAEVDALAALAAGSAPGAAETFADLALRLRRPSLEVAFLGRFSSGKSSLINCALGRRLMPVSDIAETGVVCAIRKAVRDRLTVRRKSGERLEAVCSPEALSQFVSLRTAAGPANAEIDDVETIEVELEDFPGKRSVWLDAPGIDNGEEGRRSQVLASRADVAIWTLSSTTFLSEVEAAAIAEQSQRAGPGSVVLVVNVFLTRGEPEERWREIHSVYLPIWRTRLSEHAADAGLANDWSPPLVLVSAEAASQAPTRFGGPELRALLAELDDPTRIEGIRLERARHELGAALQLITDRHAAVAAENEMRRGAGGQQAEAAEARSATRRRWMREAFGAFQARFADAAMRAAESVASEVALPLRRDGVYGSKLDLALAQAADTARLELAGRLRGMEGGGVWEGEAAEAALAERLSPGSANVPVTAVSSEFDRKTALLGAIPGLLMCLVPPLIVLGLMVAAIGAGIGGAWAGARSSVQKELAATRNAILTAAREAIARMEVAAQSAAPLALADCAVATPALPSPEPALEAQLRGLLMQTQAIADRLAERS